MLRWLAWLSAPSHSSWGACMEAALSTAAAVCVLLGGCSHGQCAAPLQAAVEQNVVPHKPVLLSGAVFDPTLNYCFLLTISPPPPNGASYLRLHRRASWTDAVQAMAFLPLLYTRRCLACTVVCGEGYSMAGPPGLHNGLMARARALRKACMPSDNRGRQPAIALTRSVMRRTRPFAFLMTCKAATGWYLQSRCRRWLRRRITAPACLALVEVTKERSAAQHVTFLTGRARAYEHGAVRSNTGTHM